MPRTINGLTAFRVFACLHAPRIAATAGPLGSLERGLIEEPIYEQHNSSGGDD